MSDLDDLDDMNTTLASDKQDAHPNRIKAGLKAFKRLGGYRAGRVQWNTRRINRITLPGQEKKQ